MEWRDLSVYYNNSKLSNKTGEVVVVVAVVVLRGFSQSLTHRIDVVCVSQVI